jgi:ribosomal protein L11 methyltransferase
VIRLAVRVQRDQAESVLAELLELAPAGVEERQLGTTIVEFAVYGAPGELPALPDLHAAAGDALVEVSTTELADDWHERWKQFHRPVLIEAPRSPSGAGPAVPSLYVRPPWEEPHARRREGVEEIIIDPGQAFGTGAHATTRMCLELLLRLAADGEGTGALLDVGIGSGVLAIAAARLGFDPVLGLDHERESVEAARQNAAQNGARIEVHRFDLRAQPLPWMSTTSPGTAEFNCGTRSPGSVVVVANLLRPLLLELARTMTSPPRHLIAGGLLRAEVEEVRRAFGERLNLSERERRESGEWAAVWLQAE